VEYKFAKSNINNRGVFKKMCALVYLFFVVVIVVVTVFIYFVYFVSLQLYCCSLT